MLSDYKIKQSGYIRALDTEEKPVTYCKIENDGINKMLVKKITIINDKDLAKIKSLDGHGYNIKTLDITFDKTKENSLEISLKYLCLIYPVSVIYTIDFPSSSIIKFLESVTS